MCYVMFVSSLLGHLNVYVYTGEKKNVSCPSNHMVHIISAICQNSASGNIGCPSPFVEDDVKRKCDGKRECMLEGWNSTGGSMSKSLAVVYKCFGNNTGKINTIVNIVYSYTGNHYTIKLCNNTVNIPNHNMVSML